MRIESSSLQLQADHVAALRRETKIDVQLFREAPGQVDRRERLVAELDDALDAAEQAAASYDTDAVLDGDPKLRQMALLLGRVFHTASRLLKDVEHDLAHGTPVTKVPEPKEAEVAAQGRIVGYRLEAHELVEEAEATRWSARGTVTTDDGRMIEFSVDMSLAYARREETHLVVEGGKVPKDPLVLSFAGADLRLGEQTFSFDIDADGTLDQLAAPGAGSYFVVDDRDASGTTDAGELLGTATGDAFGELAALDGDRNGWIDEADGAFTRLALWDPVTGTTTGLSEAGVGALATAAVSTPFAYRDENGVAVAGQTAAGVFLTEAGGAGSLRAVDLYA